MSTPASVTQYLTFFVRDDEYAVEILRVREVMETLPITRIPSTPATIRGVVNVRGTVVPIVDLGIRFGAEASAISRFTCIVVVEVDVEGEAVPMGLLVDRVNQVVQLEGSQIEPVPSFGVHVRVDFLRGMGNVGGKFVMLLDIERVLSPSDLLAVAGIAAVDRPRDAAASRGTAA